MFALLTFDAIPKELIEFQTNQNLLDTAYNYWEFFRQTKVSAHEFGEFKFLLISLSLYVAADHYIYFMQMVQKQLP